MARPKIWNKYEVALLIECYENVKFKNKNLEEELNRLSRLLRNMALIEGEQIDDEYRNLNGMHWQYGFIKAAFEKVEFETRKPTPLFFEMVDLYHSDKESFNEVLIKAYQLCGELNRYNMTPKDIKQQFKDWLSKQKLKKFTLDECVECISDVSDYAVSHGLSKTDFWQITDYKIFNRIRVAISGSKIFKHSFRHLFRTFDKAGQLYSIFLKENQNSLKIQDVTECSRDSNLHINEEENEQHLTSLPVKLEQKSDDTDRADFIKEKEAIAVFFKDDIDTANTFIELFEYQKKTCPAILLDVRSTIIGVKIEGERLRYYVDKHRRISFSKLKIGEKRYVKPFTDSLLPEFFIAVEETNKYFIAHQDEVKLNGTLKEELEDKEPLTDLQQECAKVLNEEFSSGLKLGNILVRKRFFNIYKAMFNKPLDIEERDFEKLLLKIGFNYDNIIYPSIIITEDKKNQIISYIINTLKSNTDIIYYSALYDIFKQILNSYIYDYSMLKAYLRFVNSYDFYCGEEFISLNREVEFDLKKHIVDTFLNVGKPLTYEELYAKFPNIEKAQINIVLRDREFITNYKGSSCFYIGIFYYTETDITEIKDFLRRRIEENGTTSGAELFNFIRHNLQEMFEANSDITELGFRNALKLQLEDEFDFRGDVISLDGQRVDKTDLVKNFCIERESFTFTELYEFMLNINGQSYFEVVFSYAVRINENQYIRKDKIHFEIEKIDAALEKFLTTDYLPLEDVIYFTHFPTMDFPWNGHLLESFVYSYSKEFSLFHKSFNQTIPTGAIVRRQSNIRTFEDLLIKVLQDNKVNGEIMTVDAAFDFLREHRYISVRRARDIERIILRAKREQ